MYLCNKPEKKNKKNCL